MSEIPNFSTVEAERHSTLTEIEGALCLVRDVYQYRVVSRPVCNSVGYTIGWRTMIWDMDMPRGERRLVFRSLALSDSRAEGVWYGTEVVCAHVEGWRPQHGPRNAPVELP